MKKPLTLLAAMSSTLLLVTACGEVDEQTASSTETIEQTETTEVIETSEVTETTEQTEANEVTESAEQEEGDAQSEELDEFLRGFYALEPGWEGGEPGYWTTWVEGTYIDGRTLNVDLMLAPGHPDTTQRAEEAANAIGNQIRANQPESAEGLSSIRVNDSEGNRIIQENI